MLGQHALDHRQGALLASSNLLGYLIGTLPAAAPGLRRYAVPTLRSALVVNVLMLLAMCVPHAYWLWLIARLMSGISSAFIYVFATALVLDLRKPPAATVFFASVGGGVAVTGVLVPMIYAHWPSWTSGWLMCTVLTTLLSFVAAFIAVPQSHARAAPEAPRASTGSPELPFWPVATAYGLFGFSYIVPATFLVVILSSQPALRSYAAGAWVLVGIVAGLSIVLWSRIASRFGKAAALIGALVLLSAGCAGPVFAQNVFGALIGAFGLGATFMGVAMLGTSIVRDLEPQRSSTRIAQVTAAFSVGQVLGPLYSAYAYQHSGSYNVALLVAAGAMVLAAAIVAFGIIHYRYMSSHDPA